MPKRLSV